MIYSHSLEIINYIEKTKVLNNLFKQKISLKKLTSLKNYTSIFILITLFSIGLTYFEITSFELSQLKNPKKTIILIVVDLILLLILSILIARKIFRTIQKNKHQPGRLQNKIILMFSLVAAIPTIIVTVFSIIFFNFGIHSWFDKRVSTAINESVVVAESYFKVQWKLIESDANIMAQDLNYLAPELSYGPERFEKYLSKQADDKSLVEAVIFQTSPQKIIAESHFSLSIPFLNIAPDAITEASSGNLVVIQENNDNRVRALIKLNFLPDCYLLISRLIDTKVLDHVINARGAESEYTHLKGQISSLQIQFLIIFAVVALLLLFAAIWLGLTLSSALIKPLNSLVAATAKIIEGNFDINVNVKNSSGEISVLAKAFNSMALELGNQRKKLIHANLEIQAKHHFSESVLSGVTAGVVALDIDQKISVINPTAQVILSLEKSNNLIGYDFREICPEITKLLTHALEFTGHEVKKEVNISRNGKNSILMVRIISEKFLGKNEGYIITFDDVTALVLAQRSAAWSDIARRIAHEIKNPLTPINLAAERLRRKFSNEVSDTANFERYTDMITKHVKDIGMMVEEFVNFARMPTPNLNNVELNQMVREAIFSRKCLDKNIAYVSELEDDSLIVKCDTRQISQVLLNLFKNAEEAIEQSSNSSNGKIIIRLIKNDKLAELYITDNGSGFPAELFDRLTEPYVTGKSTGTGLGLAIVKKILDDHNIEISFANNTDQGATVKMSFNLIKE